MHTLFHLPFFLFILYPVLCIQLLWLSTDEISAQFHFHIRINKWLSWVGIAIGHYYYFQYEIVFSSKYIFNFQLFFFIRNCYLTSSTITIRDSMIPVVCQKLIICLFVYYWNCIFNVLCAIQLEFRQRKVWEWKFGKNF